MVKRCISENGTRTVLLIICSLSYLLVGAAVFSALEFEEDQRRKQETQKLFRLFQAKYNITAEDFAKWAEVQRYQRTMTSNVEQWSFAGSVYFATTVITTIGYGHTVPRTDRGRIFCMIYATIGIPLAITALQSIGERFNALVRYIYRISMRRLGKKREISTNNMVVTGLVGMAITMCFGAGIFSYYEHWSYFHSFYYCFVTLTTIGFGDMVALQDSIESRFSIFYISISMLFIFIGLTIASSFLNLLVLRMMEIRNKTSKPKERGLLPGTDDNCENCHRLSTNGITQQTDEDYVSDLLRQFEDEITFTTYRTMYSRRRVSI